MIRDITIEDEEQFIILGSQISDSFNKVYKLKDEIEKEYVKIRVYLENNKVVAFLMVENTDVETSVTNLVVSIDYRRKHIADKLLDDLFNNSDSKKFVLEVKSDNYPAVNLYLKHGFNKVGIRKGYYDGVDAITMVKEYE
jgi:ribosomal-protein-alanine N-acetyltransferase